MLNLQFESLLQSTDLRLNPVSLIAEATPTYKLKQVSKLWKNDIAIKREDKTSTRYGGNKVRNLEFLLAEALAQNAKQLITIAPLGSNFVAALTSQSALVGLPVKVFHFTPAQSLLIEAQADFSASQVGTQLVTSKANAMPRLSAVPAYLKFLKERIQTEGSYVMPVGGSSEVGALGHVNAAFEFAEQTRAGAAELPDVIYVGAGTCGTYAGLMVGLFLSGYQGKLVGVRCVDRIVCNRIAIARLANRICKVLNVNKKFHASDVILEDVEGFQGYGKSFSDADATTEMFRSEEDIVLDSTYTAKVALHIQNQIENLNLRNKKILYWHTFSPKAVLNCRQPNLARSADGMEGCSRSTGQVVARSCD